MKGESYIQLCGSKVKVKGELAFASKRYYLAGKAFIVVSKNLNSSKKLNNRILEHFLVNGGLI